MAKDVLVADSLSEEMLQAGRDLIKGLDSTTSQVQSAFWFFYPEEAQWRLILSSPLVGKEGPRRFYQRVVDFNNKTTQEYCISLHDISVNNIDNQLVQLIQSALQTDDKEVSAIRFSKNAINGTFIEDALVYRSCIRK